MNANPLTLTHKDLQTNRFQLYYKKIKPNQYHKKELSSTKFSPTASSTPITETGSIIWKRYNLMKSTYFYTGWDLFDLYTRNKATELNLKNQLSKTHLIQ